MLTSIIITDVDEASARAHAHVSPPCSFVALDFRCSTGAARAASVCISPAVARQLRAVLDGALADLEVAQRAASRATDNEASETEASHASP